MQEYIYKSKRNINSATIRGTRYGNKNLNILKRIKKEINERCRCDSHELDFLYTIKF